TQTQLAELDARGIRFITLRARSPKLTAALHDLPVKPVIEHYARRMNIEQRLAEAIRSFGLHTLAGAVPLNVDLDVVLSVLAHNVCAAVRRRLPGYATATPDTLQTPLPQHRRGHPQPRRRDHRPDRPAKLSTRAPPSRPAPNRHRPLVGRPSLALPVRLSTKLGVNSLRENRR
ncbi:MAG: hypothetical protein ACRDQB_05060, partial [Thermocrispum sp.]